MRNVPNYATLREWLDQHGISQTKAAGIVGIEGRSFRRYTAPPDQPGHRDLPWSAWMLLRLYAGEVTVEEFRAEVDFKEVQ